MPEPDTDVVKCLQLFVIHSALNKFVQKISNVEMRQKEVNNLSLTVMLHLSAGDGKLCPTPGTKKFH